MKLTAVEARAASWVCSQLASLPDRNSPELFEIAVALDQFEESGAIRPEDLAARRRYLGCLSAIAMALIPAIKGDRIQLAAIAGHLLMAWGFDPSTMRCEVRRERSGTLRRWAYHEDFRIEVRGYYQLAVVLDGTLEEGTTSVEFRAEVADRFRAALDREIARRKRKYATREMNLDGLYLHCQRCGRATTMVETQVAAIGTGKAGLTLFHGVCLRCDLRIFARANHRGLNLDLE